MPGFRETLADCDQGDDRASRPPHDPLARPTHLVARRSIRAVSHDQADRVKELVRDVSFPKSELQFRARRPLTVHFRPHAERLFQFSDFSSTLASRFSDIVEILIWDFRQPGSGYVDLRISAASLSQNCAAPRIVVFSISALGTGATRFLTLGSFSAGTALRDCFGQMEQSDRVSAIPNGAAIPAQRKSLPLILLRKFGLWLTFSSIWPDALI